MMKLVPIAKELDTASARPMYLSATILVIREREGGTQASGDRFGGWMRCQHGRERIARVTELIK